MLGQYAPRNLAEIASDTYSEEIPGLSKADGSRQEPKNADVDGKRLEDGRI